MQASLSLVYLTHHKIELNNFWRYLILIGVFSIFVNIVAAHDSVKFTYKVPYAEQVEAWLVQEKLWFFVSLLTKVN